MKPYYEHAGIQIYLGDCREILPSLPKVDAVITDPPYSEVTHLGARTKPVDNKGEAGTLVDFAPITISDLRCALSIGAMRWTVAFMDWRHLSELEASPPLGLRFVRFGVWVKRNGAPQFTGDRPATGWEALAIMHNSGTPMRWNGGGKRAVWNYPQPGGEFHPTQKPNGLLSEIVSQFTDEDETILDPFMGSGTTLVAAKNLGRKAIGIEIEEKYCEIAAKRMAQEVFDFGGEAA